MNTVDKTKEGEPVLYTLAGMRISSDSSDEEGDVSLEVIGTFNDLEKAKIAQEIYTEMDTTMSCITIIPCVVRDNIPQINIMLHIFVNKEDQVVIESQCSFNDENPWIKATEDEFDSLAWPEDMALMIEEATKWVEERRGVTPQVLELISPRVKEYI